MDPKCSDTDYDESDLVDSGNEYLPSYNGSTSESSDNDSEDERFLRLQRKRRRVQAFSNSENESDQDVEMSVTEQNTEISIDGTMWKNSKKAQRREDYHCTTVSKKCQDQRHMRNDIQ